MGWRSSVLLVILSFAILFSFMYSSYQLNYAPPHDPNVIPAEPKIMQAQALAIVESEFRKNVPSYREAYLHFQYYNFSRENYENDEEYQSYLRSLVPGWKLSEIKANPSLLSLTLAFVHANGTTYSIDPQTRTFEKVCDQPSMDCVLGKHAGEVAKDRLVYEVGAIVEGSDGYNSDVHYIFDAETGRVIYHIPYLTPRPLPHRLITDNTRTVNELEQQKENARFGAAIEIEQNASEIAGREGALMRGYKPPDVIVTLYNNTDAVTITWSNHDAIGHTVTSDDGYSDILGEKLDSGLIEPGGSYTFVFIEEGPYQYHCTIHPWMKGSISIMPSSFD